MAACPQCNAENPDLNAFCGQCGSALSAGSRSAQRVEERKLATVLFADVVGFTSLAERTDPEIVAQLVDTAFRRLGETVAEHGGTVDKFMGDSVMAVFGVPTAHDDDAERAVAAALAMRDLGGELSFSIGVNSGEVMATAVGRAGDMTVIGDTVNVAARLEQAAGPGEVLCGALTYELARGRVHFEEHQAVLLKGKREPVEVFVADRLLGATEAPSAERRSAGTDGVRPAAEGAGSGEVSLVGRSEELDYLVAQWRRVQKESDARVVLLTGEPGSGKTRLQAELASIAGDIDSVTVIHATYPAYGVRGGARMAKEIAQQIGRSADAAVNARVRSVAGEIDPSLGGIDPAGMLTEQLWGFVRLMREKALTSPILMMLDDMHHGDERTLEIVSEVAARLGDVPILMLLAGRNTPSAWMSRFPEAISVRLAPLARTDAMCLARALVPERELSGEAAEFLAERANGNPLYLRELVAMARARHLFIETEGRYRLAAYEAVPATLQAVLAARLDSLDPAQKLALQHVAVLGRRATPERVGQLGTDDAESVLCTLHGADLVRLTPDGYYVTSDSLLGEVAYETLPRHLRGDLHRRAAAWSSDSEERARHLDRAAKYLSADEDLALQAALALADEGEELFAMTRHRDAIHVLQRSVELGCRRPSALLALAQMLCLVGEQTEALGILEMIEDDPDAPRVALERDHLAANAFAFADPAWALPRLEAVAQRWAELGDVVKEGWAYSNAGVSYFNLSRLGDAARSLERALQIFDEAGEESGSLAASSFLSLVNPIDPRVPMWLDRALLFADEAGDRAKQTGTLTTLAWNHFFRSMCGDQADLAAAEGFAARLAEQAEELGVADIAVQARSLLVVETRLSGRLEEAAAHAAAMQGPLGSLQHSEAWIGWAASYMAAVAGGERAASPPFAPDTASEPVVAMARFIIETELTLAGRPLESLAHSERPGRLTLGAMSEELAMFQALALVLVGRTPEAEPLLVRSIEVAELLDATASVRAGRALLAECRKDRSLIDEADAEARAGRGPAVGLADVLVLRARVACGEPEAWPLFQSAVRALAAPGLLLGLEAPDLAATGTH